MIDESSMIRSLLTHREPAWLNHFDSLVQSSAPTLSMLEATAYDTLCDTQNHSSYCV